MLFGVSVKVVVGATKAPPPQVKVFSEIMTEFPLSLTRPAILTVQLFSFKVGVNVIKWPIVFIAELRTGALKE